MAVNATLANFSDLSYRTALVIYLIALVLSVLYYARRAQLSSTPSTQRIPVAVGAARGAGDDTGRGDGDDHDGDDHGVSPSGSSSRLMKLAAKGRTPDPRVTTKIGGMTQTMVWLAVILQGISVVLRGLATHRFPWGNLYEYIALTTFISMVIAAAVLARKSMRIMWPWVLIPVVTLLFYGGMKLHIAAGPVPPALKSFWLPFHVSIVSSGAGVGLISGVASLMYITRMAQPRGTEHGIIGAFAKPLPSAKTLDAIAYRSAIWALPIFGLGIMLGALWAESAWGRFWNWDPKETVSLVTWLLYAAYLHARATSGWRDKKAAWINIAAFVTMVFNLFFINLVVSGLHSYAGLN